MINMKDGTDLKSFFISNGFQVVDKREKGGCLWVVGNKETLDPYARKAARLYHAGGRFANGKAIDGKYGWFTKCKS